MQNGLFVDYLGNENWYFDNWLHREDGPAVVFVDGRKEWWYTGIFAGSGDKPDPTLWTRLTSLEANGGPLLNGCVVGLDGTKCWLKDGLRHRADGPAVELGGGTKSWYFNGRALGHNTKGFWGLWDLLTPEQRANPSLLRWLPGK